MAIQFLKHKGRNGTPCDIPERMAGKEYGKSQFGEDVTDFPHVPRKVVQDQLLGHNCCFKIFGYASKRFLIRFHR